MRSPHFGQIKSGMAKPLRGEFAGHYRLRTGDYRLQFRVEGDLVIIEKVGHRDGFYEE